MNYLPQLILRIASLKNRSQLAKANAGFTMIELLVGAIIAFIIITPLLGMVVNLLNDDQRESAKASTEQDVQASLDYISEDVSQAVYIYDQDGIGKITSTAGTSPIPTDIGTPVLVFWKRTVVPNAIPVSGCTPTANSDCKDDSFVMSLVAYYLQQSSVGSPWCSDTTDLTKCPLNIARVEIRDGVKDPKNYLQYIDEDDSTIGRDGWFNPDFNLAEPKTLLRGITTGARNTGDPKPEVLASYIDHSTAPGVPAPAICSDVLNLTEDELTELEENEGVTDAELQVGDKSSFYSCVNSNKTLARVYIRGNALRRIQTDAAYTTTGKAFFPTGTIQVQGNSRLGK